jgi:hypothetical protein
MAVFKEVYNSGLPWKVASGVLFSNIKVVVAAGNQ